MNGVEILASTEVVTEVAYNWWLAGFIYLGFIIAGGIIGYLDSDCFDRSFAVIFGCIISSLFGIIVLGMAAVATQTPVAYETQYKVAISDNVSMVDFMEKYEIIDQEGKIYTVREIE